jgi:predicted aldo/keto reductase-like oxidoreductase
MLDTGLFESVLLQYNLLDRKHEETIRYAGKKDIGVLIMGPVAGGSLSAPSKVILDIADKKFASTPEIALRFVMANKNVNCTLSGMNSIGMIDQNVNLACNDNPLDEKDWTRINEMLEETHKLAELYCTKCNYCSPCPKGINISFIFEQMIYHKVYGLTESARQEVKSIGKEEWAGKSPQDCIGCGICESKCPQKIKIRIQLKAATNELF